MNEATPAAFVPELARELRAFIATCEDLLAMASREHQALNSPDDFASFDFYKGRKDLLTRLDPALISLRKWRQAWTRTDPAERARHPDIKNMFQMIQDLIVKILQLDRENQQALLRRGLVPAQHVPSPASQQPNYVAGLYRRHSHS